MIIVLVTCLFLVNFTASSYPESDLEWERWKQVYRKQYANKQIESKRFEIWQQTVSQIREHNLRYDQGLESYRMGVNQFTDMSWHEIKHQHLGAVIRVDTRPKLDHNSQDKIELTSLPESWDWRDQNRVTEVKNQLNCGACWAYSAVGSMEGQINSHNRRLESLSVQNLVDCSRGYGNRGCDGGFPACAYQYVIDNGIKREQDYPYTGQDGNCTYHKSNMVYRINNFVNVSQGDEIDLLIKLYKLGPVSVTIDAGFRFIFYKSGIFKSDICSEYDLNHAMLVVGYGEENQQKYWLIKNSWGKEWGEEGYVKLARNLGNMCGIASLGSVSGPVTPNSHRKLMGCPQWIIFSLILFHKMVIF